MLKITLKIDPRTKRQLELAMTEQEFGQARREFWGLQDNFRCETAAHKILASLSIPALIDQQWRIAVRAVMAPTIHVGGIYWYKDRTPPAQAETRMRAFTGDDGLVVCPNCGYLINEHDEPVAFSKTLQKPRYVCPDCNTYIIVSARKQDYQENKKRNDPGMKEE